jgi:hypothetical protein
MCIKTSFILEYADSVYYNETFKNKPFNFVFTGNFYGSLRK